MGCSCNKKKIAPAARPSATAASAASVAPNTKTPAPAPTGRSQTFVLDTADGRTQTFGSRLEALAAQVREGGTLRP